MRVTIRASQLLHPTCVPYFYLSHVLMASNLRGLTGMVRLAKHLGIGTIKGAFAISFFQHTAHEHPENCPGLYNAVHAEASKLAKKLGVSMVIPPPFQGVRPDANQALPSGCLLADFDEDSFVAPAFDRFYDRGQANELAVMLAKECRLELTRSHPRLSPSSQVMRIHQDLANQLHEMQAKHEPFLDSLNQREAAHPGAERLTSCGFIESSLYVGTTEAWLCCMQGTPTFSLESHSSFRDIWNSADLAKFRQGFFHGTTPTICKECPERTSLPASHFLGEVNRGIASLG
jgi:hypothetical protein